MTNNQKVRKWYFNIRKITKRHSPDYAV